VYSRLRLRSLIAFALVAAIQVSGFGTYRDMSVFGDVHIQGLEGKGFTSYTFWLANIYESLRVTTESFYPSLKAFQVDWVEGSFLLTTAENWRALGGLDESNFFYGDDVEFCRNTADHGLTTVHCTDIKYVH